MRDAMNFLPKEFLERMKMMGHFDFDAFCASFEVPHFRGVRLNRLKCTEKAEASLRATVGEQWTATPFGRDTYYLPAEFDGIGRLALHHAGAVYVQEPSATSAVEVLAPRPGDRVLDLCAAPGGKSTQIGAMLQGEGLLWSNEIVKNRAQILLSNIERMGIRNAVVSSCHPEQLCRRLEGFFDKMLVDAPCSGEGMFARDEQAVAEWSPEHVTACAVRQLAILDSAVKALRGGGELVYSTCTFAPEENEGVVCRFLDGHPEFELLDCGVEFGRPGVPEWGDGREELRLTRRIFPMDGGAGHFVAKFRKKGDELGAAAGYRYVAKCEGRVEMEKLYREIFSTELYGIVERFGDRLVILPRELPVLDGLGVLRAGVAAGIWKKGRVEPEHGLFMAARSAELRRELALSSEEEAVAAFLRGEEVDCDENGYTGVTVDGVTLGFGKCSGGRLKNHYPKGLRNLR